MAFGVPSGAPTCQNSAKLGTLGPQPWSAHPHGACRHCCWRFRWPWLRRARHSRAWMTSKCPSIRREMAPAPAPATRRRERPDRPVAAGRAEARQGRREKAAHLEPAVLLEGAVRGETAALWEKAARREKAEPRPPAGRWELQARRRLAARRERTRARQAGPPERPGAPVVGGRRARVAARAGEAVRAREEAARFRNVAWQPIARRKATSARTAPASAVTAPSSPNPGTRPSVSRPPAIASAGCATAVAGSSASTTTPIPRTTERSARRTSAPVVFRPIPPSR